MRLVALVESEDHVCCRYRLAAFRAPLAQAGHHLDIHPLPRSTFRRLAIGRRLEDAEAVVVQRKLLPRWTVALLRRRVRRLIFDFDDAVWLRDSYASRGFDDPKRALRFQAIIHACDLVVAGNEFLAAEAARYTSANRIVVIPTCVEPANYPVSTHAHRNHPQLVWVGSESTLRGLKRFTQTLSAIGHSIPGIRLKLICDRFLHIPDLAVNACIWRQDTEAAEIAAADIGISWVPDDPWSRGKCGLKILQYQAAGLPVITNPVGVHTNMIRDGTTGFAAVSTEEWVAAATRLVSNPELRRQLGMAGRRQVETSYSVMAGTQNWLIALDRMAGIAQLRKTG
ncbi:MAG TPA: glycosyltransferase family 4 protein [Gemmata sp.]|nr:glycosyltransferase family 4 protein [Gemmata sp.]